MFSFEPEPLDPIEGPDGVSSFIYYHLNNDQGNMSAVAHLMVAIRDEPRLRATIDCNDMQAVLRRQLAEGLYATFALTLSAIANDGRLMASLNPAMVVEALQGQLNKAMQDNRFGREPLDDFTTTLEAISNYEHLCRAIQPDLIGAALREQEYYPELSARTQAVAQKYIHLCGIIRRVLVMSPDRSIFIIPASESPPDSRGNKYHMGIVIYSDHIKLHAGCHYGRPVDAMVASWLNDARAVGQHRRRYAIPGVITLLKQAAREAATPDLRMRAHRTLEAVLGLLPQPVPS